MSEFIQEQWCHIYCIKIYIEDNLLQITVGPWSSCIIVRLNNSF